MIELVLLKSNGELYAVVPTKKELVEFVLYAGWLFQRQEQSRTYMMVQHLEIML